MKTSSKWTSYLVAAVLLGSLNSIATAAPSFHPSNKGDRYSSRQCSEHPASLDNLKVVLQLNPSQQEAWATFSQLLSQKPDVIKFQRPGSMSTLDQIQWIEKRHAALNQFQAERMQAIKTFYASLNDTQKKVFDQEFGLLRARGHDKSAHRFSQQRHSKPWM
jgi:hypothetical protein